MNIFIMCGATIMELAELSYMNSLIEEAGGGWLWLPQFNVRTSVINYLVKQGYYKMSGKNITRTYINQDQFDSVNWWAS